jgi:MoaA/NifB/PqqE/SkfB family radical SAM enzyme
MTEVFNPIDSVEFAYTQKCNIECSHCVNDCGPNKTKKLDFEKILLLLKFLPEFKIDKIGLTGGEPLLYSKEVFEVISTASKHKLKPKLISNGFWGSSRKEAERMVSKLVSCGLKSLNISTDKFHLKFVPMQNIVNIFDAARKQKNLNFCLRICFSKSYSVLDFVAENKEYFSKPGKRKPVVVNSQPIAPFGRAFHNIPKEEYITKNRILKTKCPFLRLPAINYDGRFFVCCYNDFKVKNTAFELADFNSVSPRELIESYQKSLFVFYLRHKGPYFIEKLARKHKLKKVNKTRKLLRKYIGLCDYCVLNLGKYSKKDLNEMLSSEFKKDKRMQEIAKQELKKQNNY